MKNSYYLLLLLCSHIGFSQAINVNTTTYTVPQLVNNILINSPCITANNITWRTGTNFDSVNGIGYFENTNPNFPMQSGVILSTGDAMNAPGPNTSMSSTGSASWIGDSSLEATLAASGISMTSSNATVLEFDFVPFSTHFDFDFIFASEEYGNFQCQFSDAFAFLLTNLNTGITTNLAVVPGTDDPISVVTIRDFLYNSTCNSVNAQFFGSFNGGSNMNNSATNFNGQTVVMNASSVLIPNTPYRIKLVIADRQDFQSDSAIFLSSNSFNIGQEVLGENFTVANNTAICNGQTHLLQTGLDPTTYSFIWRRNGVVILGQNGPSLTVTQAGTYEVTFTNNALPCQEITDSVVIQFYQNFTTRNPRNLFRCDTGATSYNFNLSENTTFINTPQPVPFGISYHSSLSNANSNLNPLPTSYSATENQTIFVRITNPQTGCFIVKSFQLILAPAPVAHQPTTLNVCSGTAQTTTGTFNLTSLNSQVLNGQSIAIYFVAYYATLNDATNGTNQLPGNFTSPTTTIYARVRLIQDSSCSSYVAVNLVVNTLPLVDSLDDVITCTSYTLPSLQNGNYFTASGGNGTPLFAGDVITESQTIYIFNTTNSMPACPNETDFRVTIIDPEELSISEGTYCNQYILPSLPFGAYHTAPNGGGILLAPGSALTTSQTIYFFFQEIVAPFCVVDLSFDLVIMPMQNVPTLTNAFDCNSYVLQPLSFGQYFDAPNGTGNQIPVGTAISSSQTLYIYGATGECISESSFDVVIGINFPTSLTECANYTLPSLPVGNYFTGPIGTGTTIPFGTVINNTQTIYVYAVSQSSPNCTDDYNFTVTIILPAIVPPEITVGCETYVLPAISTGNYYTGANGTGTMLNAGNTLTSSQTLFIYLNDNDGCINELSLSITVNQLPIIDSRSEIDACHSYTLTNLANGNYYTGPGGSGALLPGGTVITSSQVIYIYANENGCVAETNFQLNIFTITAQQFQNISICDGYVLPNLVGANKYFTQPGGPFGTGTELASGTLITTTQTVYIFIESGERMNCTDESSFTIAIIPTPNIGSTVNVTACNSYILPALTVGNYYTQPNKGGILLIAGAELTQSQTIFVYAETETIPNCFDEVSFTVNIYNVDQLQDVTVCENFVLPNLSVGNYYNGPNGSGGIIAQGSIISISRTLYIFGNSGFSPNCTDETSFTITIISTPIANTIPLINRTICDEDGLNDGITLFDLTTLNQTVLGTQIGAEFSVSYFNTIADANTNTNAITSTLFSTVYVRVSNSLAPNCFDIKPVTIIVNKIPEPQPVDGIVCINSATGNLLNSYMLTSGLSSNTHSFQWFNKEGIVVGASANYEVTSAGTYSVIATSTITGCSSTATFATVHVSEPAIVTYSVSEDFVNNQTLTIIAAGFGGDYEYQIDEGEFQDSPIFNNVTSGFHSVVVRDKNGCGVTTTEAIVVNYPKYFTPNGDGYNDTWNIYDLSQQEDAVIFIMDRFGKILKEIKPSGIGWDGTFNGRMMPSDDYWFTINYRKNEEFKAHFALKR
jgi:gliding motility-associated-like protein